ncbi:MAG: hypothetical protein JST04_13460 [Bdellovibrionales bacterium]|nr:hypothetical protein [Bdellovibrionales bacterium]
MKTLALLALVLTGLFHASAEAAPSRWEDLMSGDHVVLTQSLMLKAKVGGTIRVASGATYLLDSVEPLEGLSVVDYLFVPRACAHPNLESGLELVLPHGAPRNAKAEVGVYYNRGCALEVMVESKDLGRPGLFLRK